MISTALCSVIPVPQLEASGHGNPARHKSVSSIHHKARYTSKLQPLSENLARELESACIESVRFLSWMSFRFQLKAEYQSSPIFVELSLRPLMRDMLYACHFITGWGDKLQPLQ